MKAGSGTSWLVGITLLALVGGLIIYSYADWPGSRYFGIADKKFWDYLELLIVPAALAIGVYLLNRAQREREIDAQKSQQQREGEAQAAQRNRELEVENERAQDAALQAYLDQMSQLLTDKDRPLRQSEDRDEVRTLARARTLTVLDTLDSGRRKRRVLKFLYEAKLICGNCAIVRMSKANLSGADLSGADLSYASGITNEELEQQAKSLEGARMPDGQKYEDWLEGREKSQQDE